MTVFTAIIGAYDIPKQPAVITPGWNYVMYTDQPFRSDIWEVRQMTGINPILKAREIKIKFWEYVDDDFSIWVDGSFLINCNLDKFIAGNFKSPFTVMKHPLRDCIYREGDECIRQRRGDRNEIEKQLWDYRQAGIKRNSGLIQSGILMREHTEQTINFCKEWWNQVKKWSTRDQIAFTYVAKLFGWPHVMRFDYRTSREFRFKKHIKYAMVGDRNNGIRG